jgi:hypothetical protein
LRGIAKVAAVKGLLATATLVAALLVAGCGGGSSSTSSSSEAATTATTGTATTTPTTASKPEEKSKQGTGGSEKSETVPPDRSKGSGSAGFVVKGGDNSIQEYGTESSSSELDEAEAALTGFLVSKANGNYKVTCSYLSAPTRESMEKLGAASKKFANSNCPGILKALSANIPPEANQEGKPVHGIASVRIKGEHAFAIYQGAKNTPYYMVMVIEGGKFKMASLAPSPFP